MSNQSVAPERRAFGWRPRNPLALSPKTWALVIAAVLVLGMLAVGLSQIFDVGSPSDDVERVDAAAMDWRDMLVVLNRPTTLERAGQEAIDIDVLFATPQYFGASRRQIPEAAQDQASLVFYVTENVHFDELPANAPQPIIRVGGREIEAVESIRLATSDHHRATLVRFPVEGLTGSLRFQDGSEVEMVLPADPVAGTEEGSVSWELPLAYSDEYASSQVIVGGDAGTVVVPGGVSGVAVLAIMGGLLAAMWPCLFQLTAYFIPAMAGMSMQEASSETGLKPRSGVVKMAFFFVVGFTIVYTAAGAIIGYGSQQLSNMDSFYVWQRYISIGAGVVLLGLALRVAARARAPLVCKMPIVSRSSKDGIASPWESMIVGVTFATGCMTCFGSAVLIGMVLYVGLAGSPLVGATLLFLFSLGMGIPLVVGSIAMAKILPTLFKMEKLVPWMGAASALLIAIYAGLLISGNFMTLSSLFFRLTGNSPV